MGQEGGTSRDDTHEVVGGELKDLVDLGEKQQISNLLEQ